MEKISVIIPAFNEEENIAKTIKLAKESKNVDEVLVVNNLSTDKTEEVSIANGARVVNCNEQGKGNAMEVGIQMAKNEIIIFLDADVKYVKENVVEKLCEPIIKKEVDFVKSSFDRTTGGTTGLRVNLVGVRFFSRGCSENTCFLDRDSWRFFEREI